LRIGQGVVGRDRRAGDRHHGRHARAHRVLVPPAGRVRTARNEAHPLGKSGIDGLDGEVLAARRRRARIHDRELELGLGQSRRGQLSFQFGTGGALDLRNERRLPCLRERRKQCEGRRNKGCHAERNH
jgi:hypothetical protein